MARKSLRVSQEQLEKAKRAFNCTGWTQKELATEVDVRTRQPIGNFLAGKTVDRKVFQEICFKLELNWQEVADLEEHTRSHSAEVPQPQEQAQEETVAKNTDFVGREEAIANTTSEEETLEPLRLRLEPLTERVRAWQLEEESLDQQLDALVDISSDDPNFVGRGQASAHLKSLVNEGAKVILIQAEGGVGKTTLARQWFELQGLKHLELRVGITSQNLHSVEDWVRHKLRDRFQENPERNFLTMLEQLKLKLQTERMGVLIDNLEPALINGEFIEPHQSYYIELLTVLAHPSVNSITLVTSREPLYEPGVMGLQTVKTYSLEPLTKEAWERYFDSRNISTNVDALSEIYQAYGGNAEVMSILSDDIRKESQGNLEVYWQQNRDDLLRHRTLEKLVQHQFNKLKDDNPLAHKLLCRLGVYPAQDVSFIPKVWFFCLLWDVPKKQRRRVIDGLLERSFVKVRKVSENEYYLHPVIRAEAIESLNLIEEANAQKILLIKTEIEAILTSNQNLAQDLQTFLVQLKEKSNLVRVPCHPANVRAFYFSLFYDLTTARHIAGELGSTCEFEGVDENVFDYDLVYKRLYDLYLDLSLVSALSCDYYSEFIRELEWCRVDSVCDYKLQEEIQLFKDKLPETEKNWERFLDDEDWEEDNYWQNNEQDWIEPLRKLVIEHRKLPLDWQFSDEQTKLLNQYYDANKMLVDCLDSSFELSYALRSHIEDTLLLPIAEIEKLTPQD
jgi:hypothetical protein